MVDWTLGNDRMITIFPWNHEENGYNLGFLNYFECQRAVKRHYQKFSSPLTSVNCNANQCL